MVHTIQTAAERRHYTLRRIVERFAVGAMVLCTAITVFFLFAILGYVIFKGAGAIDWKFLTQLPLPPGEDGGGIANALVGSVMVVACALLMALPIGFGAAIFVNEFPNAKLGRFVRFMAEVLTGVPSIVVGLFAYAMVVRPMGTFSGFSGSVAYAFIMVPILLITSHEGFRLVPASMREASLALGVPKWRTILGVVLPVSRRALITGAVLAFSRALGEAAPALFTAFGNSFWNLNLGKPIATVPMLIYTYATGPYDDWHQKAWGASFVLMMVVFFTSVMTRAFLRGKTNE
jgi:phosphate transport system permease protein